MYLGIVLLFCGLPLALGSWYSYIPSMVIVCLFVYRTGRKDRMLHEGLAGYADYAQDVHYRLVPGYLVSLVAGHEQRTLGCFSL